MDAVIVHASGGPEQLAIVPLPVPIPGPHEVLIRVAAAGINPADLAQRAGRYPPPPGASPLLGLEVSGTVVAVGPEVTAPAVGDRIMALLAGGGYAAYAVADARACLPIPASLSLLEAAALPEALYTVWSTVFQAAALAAGEWLLVHGGTGGVGSIAVQLGRAFGTRVAATAGTDAKRTLCAKLGAEIVVDYHDTAWAEQLRCATDGGVDVILDHLGVRYFATHLDLLRRSGRLVLINTERSRLQDVALGPIITKNLHVLGAVLRPRPIAEKAATTAALHARVLPLLEPRTIVPLVDRVFPLTDVAAAHTYCEQHAATGKVLLQMEPSL